MRTREDFEAAAGSVACDARHLPIVVVRWTGKLDVSLVAGFDEWLGRLLDHLDAEEQRAAMVVDITRTEPPDGESRRALVALRGAKHSRIRDRFVTDLVVIQRPMHRAVMQTLHWIAPQLQSTTVGSLDEALRRAHEELTRAGIAVPRLSAFEFEGP